MLIEWLEPEQIYERYSQYYVVCGTQTRPRVSSRYILSITETAVNITGLSLFTRYECCVTVIFLWYRSVPSCVNATTAPGILCVLTLCNIFLYELIQISLLPLWLSTLLRSHISPSNWSGPDHNPSMAPSPTTPLHACQLMELL